MRFVPVKTMAQQDLQAAHRIRERLVCQRTALINQLRGLLAEYGIILAKGPLGSPPQGRRWSRARVAVRPRTRAIHRTGHFEKPRANRGDVIQFAEGRGANRDGASAGVCLISMIDIANFRMSAIRPARLSELIDFKVFRPALAKALNRSDGSKGRTSTL